MRKRDGTTLTFQYDALNRVTRKTVPERAGLPSTHTRDVFYGYDLSNLQTYARFDSASGEGVTNVYDGFGRLTSSTLLMDSLSRTLLHRYREDGNRTRLTHPDLQAFTYDYDALGRLSGVYEGIGTAVMLDQFAYNPQGLPASRSERYGSSVTYGYDPIGRLATLTDAFVGGTGNVALGFGYNPASQVVSRSRNNDAYAWTGAYNVSRTYTVNGLNQYTAAGSATFAYDANGNLVSDANRTFTYDVENRLVSAGGAQSAGLRYDPLGRLYEVTGGSGTTRFLYDGDALVAEYVGTALTARYVHGSNAGADDPLIWYGGGTTRWLHSDHQGSIVAVTNGSGALSSINAYDEWGIPNATNQGRFQYTGQAWIPELGMYHYKARIYSPTLGRFLQTDPVGYADQMNLYAYVGNDPINGTDPTGMAGVGECDTGSLIKGNNGGCRVAEGFPIPKAGQRTRLAQARRGIGHNRGPVWRAPRRSGTPRIGAGGVRAHEGQNGAHTYRMHIGKTDAFLRGRIEGGLTRASTFSNEMMANAALTAAVQQNGPSIDAWLTSEFPSSKQIEFVSPIPVGRVMDSRFRVEEGYRAVFILSPNQGLSGGDFNVITGWVEP